MLVTAKTALRAFGVALTAMLPGMSAAVAQAPEPWQLNLQTAHSPVMEQVVGVHDLLIWIIFGIALLVLCLLGYAGWRFRESKSPEPSRRSHNTILEMGWTGVPVLLLVIIAIPSFKLLYYMDVIPETEMTVKAIGRQWYWTYEYPDHGGFTFDANPATELQPGQPRLLQTDYELVLPAETNIRLLTTASDVLHAWAMPSLGVKQDAIPGRLNDTWFRINEPGMYYGQCSELCGVNHAFMPITIRALAKPEFDAWVQQAQQEFAKVDGERPVDVASAPAP